MKMRTTENLLRQKARRTGRRKLDSKHGGNHGMQAEFGLITTPSPSSAT